MRNISTKYDDLKHDYKALFNSMFINNDVYPRVSFIANKIRSYKSRYESVNVVPYFITGIIHYRESGFNFSTHLHNGDPLTWWTINEPKGRPANGKPPFRWEDSALDAISLKKHLIPKDNSIEGWLYFFEAYNGFGYRIYRKINSPYLWSGSNHYIKGKYSHDGRYDESLVDKQIGCAVILKYGMEHALWNL